MSLRPKVALSNEFLIQLSKLPSQIHSKVMKWAIQFQTDPTSPGINYENIHAARDPSLKSIRVDRDWRGIVSKPASGDVYILLYVDRHDAAYRWAEKRKLTINPVTGAMQLVTLEETPEVASAPAPADQAADAAAAAVNVNPMVALFSHLNDRELMSLGVPDELVELVRSVTAESELDAIQPRLPVEAYEGLFLVAAGDSVTQVLTSRETRVDQAVDTQDFAAALTVPESRSRFVVVSDDETLTAILNAPLAQWRVFLHPTQQKLASGDRSGPVRVLGGAGTGKTVLAMHRAKWLAENRMGDGQKVLFTTFTRNLANDIEQNLKTLCSVTALAKLEVRNLDGWVNGFLRSRKLEHRIVYDRKQEGAEQAWQAALAVRNSSLDLPENFYEQELEQVVLANGVTKLDEYRTVRRTGRGVILNRAKRDAVWPVFEEYRGQLASRKLKEVDDAYREMAGLLNAEGDGKRPFASIVVDETQDFGPQALKLLRAMAPSGQNDLFFVGDGHQRIYRRNRSALSKCGIEIRGRSKKLYINYRTTDEIRRRAVALLENIAVDDLDDGHDEVQRYRSLSHGPKPIETKVEGLEKAFAAVSETLKEWRDPDQEKSQTFCVVASSERNRDALKLHLQSEGVRTVTVTPQSNQTDEQGAVYLSTMHRAKGLEFDGVVVVAPQDYLFEPTEETNWRQLLYVALTRAKRAAALITY
jgi:AAA domain/UvrD-like helicase C-terminal domain